jgi:hypothetical protein
MFFFLAAMLLNMFIIIDCVETGGIPQGTEIF